MHKYDTSFESVQLELEKHEPNFDFIHNILRDYINYASSRKQLLIGFDRVQFDGQRYLKQVLQNPKIDLNIAIEYLGKLASLQGLKGKFVYQLNSEFYHLLEHFIRTNLNSKDTLISVFKLLASLCKNNYLSGEYNFKDQQIYLLTHHLLSNTKLTNLDVNAVLFAYNHLLSYEILKLDNNSLLLKSFLVKLIANIYFEKDNKVIFNVYHNTHDISSFLYNIARCDFILREHGLTLFDDGIVTEVVIHLLENLRISKDNNALAYIDRAFIKLSSIIPAEKIQLSQGLFYLLNFFQKQLSPEALEACQGIIDRFYQINSNKRLTKSSNPHLEISKIIRDSIVGVTLKDEVYVKCGFHIDIVLKFSTYKPIYIEIDGDEYHQQKRDHFKEKMLNILDSEQVLLRIKLSEWAQHQNSKDWICDQIREVMLPKKQNIAIAVKSNFQHNTRFSIFEELSNSSDDDNEQTVNKKSKNKVKRNVTRPKNQSKVKNADKRKPILDRNNDRACKIT